MPTDAPSRPLALVANAADGTISAYRLTGDGVASRLAVSAVAKGCSCFAVDPVARLVYAGSKAPGEGIVTARLDTASGRLERLSATPALAGPDGTNGAMTYLALTPDRLLLLGVSYAGGFGFVCPVDPDSGKVGDVVSRIAFPNLHSVAVSADGRYAYFVSLGADLVAQFALTSDGELIPLAPPSAAAPSGSGPRHIVLDDRGENAYVMTEFSGEALWYQRDVTTGALTLTGATPAYVPDRGLSHSVIGADPVAGHLIWGADLHLGNGVLYCSERCESTLAILPIRPDGSLQPPVQFLDTPPQPRGFGVSPDRALVVVAGERADHLGIYQASADGELTEVTTTPTGAGSNWVRVVDD